VPIRQTLNGDAAQGPPGPPGTLQVGTGDAFFSLDQQVALATWTVAHNLGKYPSVTVIDSTRRRSGRLDPLRQRATP
jgi:hypothetical protein